MTSLSKRSGDARELYDLKQKAVVYYKNNGVPKKVEEILNNMFYDNPSDVYGHMANYFESFALTPLITKLRAREVLDSKAQPTIQTEVYCLVKNHEECVSTSTVSSQNWFQDSAKPEERDEEDRERVASVREAIKCIKEDMAGMLKGTDPTDQKEADIRIFRVIDKIVKEDEERVAKENEGKEVDEIAVEETDSQKKIKSPKGKAKAPAVAIVPDEPREKLWPGCNALSALSQGICIAGANLKHIPVYEHIACMKQDKAPASYHIPLPVVTILYSGKAFPGKLNCVKEFMIVPRHDMPLSEAVKHITNIHNNIAKTLVQKSGVTARNVHDSGALCTTLDRPEQGLDMIQDTITQLELKPGEDFQIILNCAAHETFDLEKGKYEVLAGTLKGFDDMVDFWSDLVSRYPAIVGLIDPLRKQEKEQWMKLCDVISEKCFVIGDYVHHRPGILKDEEIEDDFKTSAVVFRLEQMNQVTDILESAKKMVENENQIVISTSSGETADSFLVDLAVGLDARFIKIGGATRGERISKINRLLQLEDNLKEQGLISAWAGPVYPKISLPPPPEEEEEQNGENQGVDTDKRESPGKKK